MVSDRPHDAVEDYRRRLKELRLMQLAVNDVRATARTRDGMVRVEVGPHGELRDLQIDQRACERMSAQRLTRVVLELVGEASAKARGQAREITGRLLPAEMADRLRDGEEDLTVFLPDTLRIPDDLERE